MSDVNQQLSTFLQQSPSIHPTAYVHPRAYVEGATTLGPLASVWPMAVLRADINSIIIGEGTNIQDGCIVHLADDFGVSIGSYCTVGHMAVVHACTVENNCLIGIQSTILDGAFIGRDSIIGAQALVTRNTRIPPRSLVLGSPGKVVRSLTSEEVRQNAELARKYITVAEAHRHMTGPTLDKP